MSLTRKEFLRGALALLASGAGAGVLAACSDDEDGDGGSGGSTSSGTGGSTSSGTGGAGGAGGAGDPTCGDTDITANHGHAVTVPWADVVAGQDMSYSIMGSGTHDHMVTVTAADFTELMNGNPVTITSSTGSQHTHDVTILCA